MKPPPFDYHRPSSLEEALSLKGSLGSAALVLAGGQSLIPLLNMRLARPEAVIDIGAISDLDYVRGADKILAVGSMTRTRSLERSEEAFAACPLLRKALRLVAHAAIRNRGTVGGAIAHADPAAELPAVLALLGGSVIASGLAGAREVAVADFFRGHFTTALEPEEILTEVRFPRMASGHGYAFCEIARRHGDFALAGVGAITSTGTTRLVMFGVDSRPVVVESDDPEEAAGAVNPTSDIHGPAAYRRQLVRVLAESALVQARAKAAE
jgi:carbon-monoxide dehydrogenase medium subunit